jgi:hypothetical protein
MFFQSSIDRIFDHAMTLVEAVSLARPRLRPARSRGGMVGLGAASVG